MAAHEINRKATALFLVIECDPESTAACVAGFLDCVSTGCGQEGNAG